MLKNTLTSYGSIAKFFHWMIFVLVACMLFIGYFMDDIQSKDLAGQVYNAHKVTGIFILLLMLLRLTWKLSNPQPISLNTRQWERLIERGVHWLLYILLICMPLSGWMMSIAAGKLPNLFGWSLGFTMTKNEGISNLFFTIHNTLAIVIITVVSLHILAALYHYVIKKDDVLQRML